jgi:hypothetical protein
MRRKLLILLAVVVVLAVVVAAPVSAKKPLRGDQTMVLNQLPDGSFGLYGCPELSWFGSITIDETTYGMALYPLPGRLTGDPKFPAGGTILHYEEGWAIFAEQFEVANGIIVDCVPGEGDPEPLLAGEDKGVGSFLTGKFRSNGTVDHALDPFAEWLGRKVHQDGTTGPVDFDGLTGVLGFYGDLRLN